MIPLVVWGLLLGDALAQRPGPCVDPWRSSVRPPFTARIVSDTRPLAVHWTRPQDLPRARAILDHAELAWAVQVDQLGFRPPRLPDAADGPELDIYLAPIGHGEGYAAADPAREDGTNQRSAFIVIDQDLPMAWIPMYTVHEFNHVLQWGTDASEWTLPLWEGVATASQTWTLGEDGGWDLDVDSFQGWPWLPALLGDSSIWYTHGIAGMYEYGTALWVMHLDEIVGDGDGTAGARLWEAAANEGPGLEPDVVDAFAETSMAPLGEAMNLLARTRFLAGSDWDERGLRDAERWSLEQLVPAERLSIVDVPVWPTRPLSFAFEVQPMTTGQAFLEIPDLDGSAGELSVGVRSSFGLWSALLVLWWGEDGVVGELSDYGVAPSVDLDLTGVTRMVVAVSNLGESDFDPDISDFWVHGDQELSLSRMVGPGGQQGADDPPWELRGGCGCATGSGAPGWAVALAALVGCVRRRRRRADLRGALTG